MYRPGDTPSETSYQIREPSPVTFQFPSVISISAPPTDQPTVYLEPVPEDPASPYGVPDNASITPSEVLSDVLPATLMYETPVYEYGEIAPAAGTRTQRSSVSDDLSIITLPSFVHYDRSGSYYMQNFSNALCGFTSQRSSLWGAEAIPHSSMRVSRPGSSNRPPSSERREPNPRKRRSEPQLRKADTTAKAQDVVKNEGARRERKRVRPKTSPDQPERPDLDERDITETEAAVPSQRDFNIPLPSYTENYVRLALEIPLPPSPSASPLTANSTRSFHQHSSMPPSPYSATHVPTLDLDDASPPIYRAREPTSVQAGFIPPTLSRATATVASHSVVSTHPIHSSTSSIYLPIRPASPFEGTPDGTTRPLPAIPPLAETTSLDSRWVPSS